MERKTALEIIALGVAGAGVPTRAVRALTDDARVRDAYVDTVQAAETPADLTEPAPFDTRRFNTFAEQFEAWTDGMQGEDSIEEMVAAVDHMTLAQLRRAADYVESHIENRHDSRMEIPRWLLDAAHLFNARQIDAATPEPEPDDDDTDDDAIMFEDDPDGDGVTELRDGGSVAALFGLSAPKPASERTFIIPAGRVPEIEQLANKWGVDLTIGDARGTFHDQLWPRWFGPGDAVTPEKRARFDRYLDRLAAGHRLATVSYPAWDGRYEVIGVAKRVSGDDSVAMLHSVPGHTGVWTPERRAAFSFKTCDLCGTSRERHKVYLIHDKVQGVVQQAGGSCAANLDLGKKLKEKIERLDKAVGEAAEMFGGGAARWARGLLGPGVIGLIEGRIREHGYTSGKAAYAAREEGRPALSTREAVEYLMEPGTAHPREQAAYRRDARRYRTAYATPAGRSRIAAVWDAAQRFTARKVETADPSNPDEVEFAHNLQTATAHPHVNTLGLFVFAVFAAADADTRVERPERAGAWDVDAGMRVGSGQADAGLRIVLPSDLVPVMRRGGWDPDSETDREAFATLLGIKPSMLERAWSRPAKPMPKGILGRVTQHPAGLWYVRWISERASDYGVTVTAHLVRHDDGAELDIGGAAASSVEKGWTVRLGSAKPKLGSVKKPKHSKFPGDRWPPRISGLGDAVERVTMTAKGTLPPPPPLED